MFGGGGGGGIVVLFCFDFAHLCGSQNCEYPMSIHHYLAIHTCQFQSSSLVNLSFKRKNKPAISDKTVENAYFIRLFSSIAFKLGINVPLPPKTMLF
jgi:hypothetical protein